MSDSFRKSTFLQSRPQQQQSAARSAKVRPHTKWAWRAPAKRLVCQIAASLLLVLAAACHRHTSFSGPPDTVEHIVMSKWVLQPRSITVRRGARVELIVESDDVEHGIGISGLGISEPVRPGQPATVRFLAEKSGTYAMRCTIACGRGHDAMKGKLIVVD